LALYYLETSALAKLYVREAGTDTMLRLATERSDDRFALLAIAKVELQSAVRRRQRTGDLAKSIADRILSLFELHMEGRYLHLHVNEIVIDTACVLIDRYGLTTMDAIHLSACLSLTLNIGTEPAIFVSADQKLLRAADSEGVQIPDVSVDN
jgi:uncharacterized protein